MNDFQQAYGGQLAPQGFFGGLIGAPLGGLIGKGIGGLFGNANLGHRIGQVAGGIGGGFLPFSADPATLAYAQQVQQQQLQQQQLQQAQLEQIQQQWAQQQMAQQLQQAQLAQQVGQQAQIAPQGWFGNLIGQVAQPLGGAIGGLFGHSGVGGQIGNVAGQLGRLLPFSSDPVAAAYAQQQIAQQAQQQQMAQLAALQQAQQAQQLQALQQAQAIQQAQAMQQAQLAPQGFFGNLIGHVAAPLGGAIGGLFGHRQLGNSIGNVAGHFGSMLPFNVDPMMAAAISQQQAGAYTQPTLH